MPVTKYSYPIGYRSFNFKEYTHSYPSMPLDMSVAQINCQLRVVVLPRVHRDFLP